MTWFKRIHSKDNEIESRGANFYFYFKKNNKPSAEKLQKELANKGFKTDLHWLDHDDGQWSLAANKRVSGIGEVSSIDDEFNALAQKYDCEYDGHELEV